MADMADKSAKRPFQPEGMSAKEQLTANAIEDFLRTIGSRAYRYSHKWERRPEGYHYITIQLED